ncbi:natterin-3-like [Gadus macrocephalus]|uniref:natterin-3-like n=1 Tax=Gadus macrocephalus TaxID=80720 RepID=UPI0028CBA4BB|nr:natterin-3-like [Gadus macrocephalus]
MRHFLPFLLLLLQLCSCDGFLKPELEEVVPSLDAHSTASPREMDPGPGVPEGPPLFGENVNLQWVTWEGVLPNGTVSIFNDYAGRTDYVCKVNCEAGFYNPSMGNFCLYPYSDQEYTSTKFQVLVNVDHFEFLEWKEDSYGSVPQHAIRTCHGVDIFVGKNKYGLGKVVSLHEAFFLPWEGDEYWYKKYQVLSINRDAYSQHISHVRYAIDQMELFHHPPEALQLAKVTNLECTSVEKRVSLEKSSSTRKTWDIGRQTRNGSVSTMKAQVPLLGPGTLDFTKEQTVSFSEGTSLEETLDHEVAVELLVPPNHSCTVRMEGRKMTADLPFTARLSRTNPRGETRWTSVTGTYDGVQVGEISAVVERCQLVADVVPCAPHPQ